MRVAVLCQAGVSELARHLLIWEHYRLYGLLAEAIDLLQPLSEAAPGLAVRLNLGHANLARGPLAEVSDSFEAALTLAEEFGDSRSAGESNIGLSLVARLDGDAAVFESSLEQSRSIFELVGDDKRLQELERLTE